MKEFHLNLKPAKMMKIDRNKLRAEIRNLENEQVFYMLSIARRKATPPQRKALFTKIEKSDRH